MSQKSQNDLDAEKKRKVRRKLLKMIAYTIPLMITTHTAEARRRRRRDKRPVPQARKRTHHGLS